MTAIDWSTGTWLHEPPSHSILGSDLVVTTAAQSDFWSATGYGFTHYSGHALLIDFPPGTAMEVEFSAGWTNEFDQAGLFLHVDEEHWIKAGVELTDGVLGLGAVVTNGKSDWSVGFVTEWMHARIRVRVSRSNDAIAIRARTPETPWRLVRLAPIDPDFSWQAGPLAASPSSSSLEITFHSWEMALPDSDIPS